LKHGRHPSLNFPFQLPAMAIKASMALTPPDRRLLPSPFLPL
jgi:hypothetical protein